MFLKSINFNLLPNKRVVRNGLKVFLRSCSVSRNAENIHGKPEIITEKIIYNSKVKRSASLPKVAKKSSCVDSRSPAFLQLLKPKAQEVSGVSSVSKETNQPVFPLKLSTPSFSLIENEPVPEKYVDITPSNIDSTEVNFYSKSEIKKSINWMNDYEKYCDVADDDDLSHFVNYGTPNRSIPVSNTTCGGCGSYLHCQEPSLPGYLPSELFLGYKSSELSSALCQRCHFLQNYNIALSVQVDKDIYNKILPSMKPNALVVLLVDLTDFPCSIWPDILGLLGHNRPLFIVGNKVDLLWGDCKGWLKHVEILMRSYIPKAANIMHTCLISAKTGYGVEDLVSALHHKWKYKGDVYLVGCTNVGKSTLFNALLQSDYCKTKAVDITQRATTAPWPGTTLSLLRFPILRPQGWRLFLRSQRLSAQRSQEKEEKTLSTLALRAQKKKLEQPIQLMENITHTFSNQTRPIKENADIFHAPNAADSRNVKERISLVGTDIVDFKDSKWFYDTPGVVHSDQILDLLTTEELVLTIPKKIIEPRSYWVHPQWTIFVAGLSRLDYVQGSSPVRLTVFASNDLPITICSLNDADEVYSSLLGSDEMAVPCGNNLRFKKWPGLEKSNSVRLCGIHYEQSCADIVLSSSGWISVTPGKDELCDFVPWTPSKKGIYVRTPSLLPYAVQLRGKLKRGSPAYGATKPKSF